MNPSDNNTAEGQVKRTGLLRVNGQLAPVVGAGRGIGIGAAIAQLLAQSDAEVVLNVSARGGGASAREFYHSMEDQDVIDYRLKSAKSRRYMLDGIGQPR